MKRALFSLAVLWFFQGGMLRADEPLDVQLEFVRRLRAKGYTDLALEQIQNMRKTANPALLSLLQLEQARTMLATAREKEPEQRPPLFAAARAELEAFVAKNPGGPEGAQGRLEIARLAAFAGQALLTKAIREDDPAVARKAEQQFIQAGMELDAAAKVLGKLAEEYKNPDPEKEKLVKQQLEQERLQARFDRASNFIDQALTYINIAGDEANRKRAETVDEARKAFEAIAEDGDGTGLLAAAWLIKVYQEGTDPQNAEKFYKRVMDKEKGDQAAQPAQRWARLFFMQGVMKNPKIKSDNVKKWQLIEAEGKKWLKDYPAFHKSPEGLLVRFETGQAMYFLAQSLTKDSKDPKAVPPKAALDLYKEAQKHFTAVADSDCHKSEEAGRFNVQVGILKMGEKTAAADLKDFEECFLKAQVEIDRMRQALKELQKDPAPKMAEKLEADRQLHMKETIKALNRGLLVADAKTPPAKLDEARFFLGTAYLNSGDSYRAAVALEALGRAKPPGKRSSSAAAYALQSYAEIWQRDHADVNRLRLKELAEFVLDPETQKSWATDPVTGVAHYQLAMLHNKDNDYKRAIAHLEKLTPDFHGYLYAQGQLAYIALAGKEKAQGDEEKKTFMEIARKAILRMPNLPADADPNTAAMYFHAQSELATFLYADAAPFLNSKESLKAVAKYAEMAKFLEALRAKLEKSPAKISMATRTKLDFSLGVLAKYSQLGLADVDYRAGQYDKVLKTTAEAVAAVKKLKGDDKSPIPMKEHQVVGELLGLALRANVQKGNIAEAKELLKFMERLRDDQNEYVGGGSTAVLRSLIGDLQLQIKDLKETKDQAKLKATVTNFSAFIDELAGTKGLELRDIMFLANCYSSLEQYPKAANLYAKIPPPKCLDKDQLNEEEEKEVGTYWFLQVEYAKALRHSAQGKEDLAKAKKVLDILKGHKNVRFQIFAEKEQNHILEDGGLYGLAIKGWGAIMKGVAPKIAEDPKLKELYFECYYQNAWCLYKYSQTEKVVQAQKEKAFLKTAANSILRLERAAAPREGWQIVGRRFEDLLQNEKKLRDEYEKLKKSAAK